jgi:hypothetical protein
VSIAEIRIEPISADIEDYYRSADLVKGRVGAAAIDWIFTENEQPFCVARVGGEIVGLSSYIQSRMVLHGEGGVAFQAVDSFVSANMRGQGMFAELARVYGAYLHERRADVLWGFPNANAAPIWFGKLDWTDLGQVPLLIKPLRAGYFLRKLGLSVDFPLTSARDQNLKPSNRLSDWVDEVWEKSAAQIGCAIMRDRTFLEHRLFDGPYRAKYRVVADERADGALVATRRMQNHGAELAYIMEALGGDSLQELLVSELAKLRDEGAELALAWCFPWSPNYRALRRSGFFPLLERFRPNRVWLGARALSSSGAVAQDRRNWYVSYLDSDTA